MRFRAGDLHGHGWRPLQTLQIPDWCGCSTEYLPVPVGDGWWHLVPIWEPDQTPNPLRRFEPGRPVLVDRPMILRLTSAAAALKGRCATQGPSGT
jgi:hypothetical protein